MSNDDREKPWYPPGHPIVKRKQVKKMQRWRKRQKKEKDGKHRAAFYMTRDNHQFLNRLSEDMNASKSAILNAILKEIRIKYYDVEGYEIKL